MAKWFVILALAAVLSAESAWARHSGHSSKAAGKSTVRLIHGLGEVHHPVSTSNRQAQKFFNQGLALVYGFNHDEARRSFEQAAKLDPKLAMAWWGVALTLGPNYNLPVDPEREKAGYDAVQKAIALSGNASEAERAYIMALSVRYSNDPKADLHQLDVDYSNAMKKLATQYPDDLDAATLCAESGMNLHPWKLWLPDGRPNEGTEEIVTLLESVLRRDPNHLGANHYYIHAIEASPHPERGLAAANRLEKLAPAAGHLVHMPAHIYARVGDHAQSALCNEAAAAADQRYLAESKVQGVYPMMYYSHNLHFLAYAATMRGDFDEAKNATARLIANVSPAIKEMPMLEGFLPTPIVVLVAFERWKDILKLPAPDPSLKITTAVWHFGRGLAYANLGKADLAALEQRAWQNVAAQIPPDTMYDDQNQTGAVFKIHQALLLSAMARSRHDDKAASEALNQAIAAEDALNYSEPPAWYPPIRPQLGRLLLSMKQLPDAEKTFRAGLDKSARDGRALAGLRDALTAQNRKYEADQIDRQYRAVWKRANTGKE